MRKKILDAALLFAFALCLIVTSNIQEEAAYVAELEIEAVPLQDQEAEPEEMQFSAGVAAAISANSFTTESDEETGGNHWKLQLQFTPEDPRRSLAVLPLSIKAGGTSVGIAHITSAVSDTPAKLNIMEYDLELLQNPGEDSEISLTTENLDDTSLREIWYRLDETFTVKFHVE